MPDLATIQAARPLCPRDRFTSQAGLPNTRKLTPCYGPMRYEAASNQWRCRKCLNATSGATVVALRTKITTLEEAA